MLRVSDHGRADVYNLTVAGAPEYFANGVLVHNCDAARYMVVHVDGLPVEVPKPSTYRLGATYQPKDSRPALLRRAA